MARFANTHLARLATGHLRCLPCKCDGPPLSLCHPSRWISVHHSNAPCLQRLISVTKPNQVAFIVPSNDPRECHNEITPNDMRTDVRCAVMGVALFFGAWLVVLSCEQPLRT